MERHQHIRVSSHGQLELIEKALDLNYNLMSHLSTCPKCVVVTCPIADELIAEARTASKGVR